MHSGGSKEAESAADGSKHKPKVRNSVFFIEIISLQNTFSLKCHRIFSVALEAEKVSRCV